MKNITKKITLSALCLFSFFQIFSQPINQVVFAAGGLYGSPGNKTTIGVYDPNTKKFGVIDSTSGNYTNDILVSGNMAYVIADNQLRKFNLDNYNVEASTNIVGAQRLAEYGSMIIVTKGFGATDTNYVQAFNKSDLSLAFSINNISDECAGITVVGDTAYVAVPGGFLNTTGSLALINLSMQTLASEIDLGSLGEGILEVVSTGTDVIAISSKLTGFSVTSGVIHYYNTLVDSIVSKVIDIPISGGTALVKDTLYCNFNEAGIGTYSLSSWNILDTMIIAGSYSRSKLETNSKTIYATTTDFFSYGRADLFSLIGIKQDSFNIGIAPNGFDFDYRVPVVNKMPIALNDVVNTPEDSIVLINVLSNDFDLDQDSLTLSLIILPLNGNTVLVSSAIQYTPYNGFFGIDSFSYSICDNGVGTLCDTAWVKVIVNKYTGIKSISEMEGFNVYPNPTNNRVEIYMDASYNKLTLLDLRGRVLIQQNIATNINNKKLDLSNFANGTYMLKLENETKVVFQRIVKN